MACMNMYNSEHQNNLIGPRISFSSDFVVDPPGQMTVKKETSSTDPQHDGSPATDFEFSATDDKYLTVAAADELFFKGKLLPLKENCRTLKEELLQEEDEEEHAASRSRPSKMPMAVRWKGFLGMRGISRAHHHQNATKEVDGGHAGSLEHEAELDAGASDQERKRVEGSVERGSNAA